MQRAVPSNCNTLLLGDSVLMGVDEKKMSTEGRQVRNLAVPGLTIQHLHQWLTTLRPSPHIRLVTCHVGINDCKTGPIPMTEWARLIQLLKRVFPRAKLQASSLVPPLGQHPFREAASQSTSNLRRSCINEGIVFINNTPSFLARSGAPKKALYRDRLHPSVQGTKYLAMNIRFGGKSQDAVPSVNPQTIHRTFQQRHIDENISYADVITRQEGPDPATKNYTSQNAEGQLVKILTELFKHFIK